MSGSNSRQLRRPLITNILPLGTKESMNVKKEEALRFKSEKAAFEAKRKLLEKFVEMARSPVRAGMMNKTIYPAAFNRPIMGNVRAGSS